MHAGLVERAYQLARDCATIDQIRGHLMREGYESIDAHLQGSLRRDLKKLLKQ